MKIGGIKRRTLLRATGLGAGALFLPSLGVKRSKANSDAIPKRIVIIVTPHQVVGDAWEMLRNNPADAAFDYAFDDPNPESFSEVLRPLHPYRDKLLAIDGVGYLSGYQNEAGVNNAHDVSCASALTGARITGYVTVDGASVDQIIAREVAVEGRLPSLELATGGHLHGGYVNLGPNARAPVEVHPRNVFNRLFPADTEVPENPTVDDLVRSRRANVLDRVAMEYETLATRLSSEDRRKLESHRDMVADLQSRIEALGSLVCDQPDEPEGGWSATHATSTPDDFAQFAMLTAAALACDLTRVVTIQVEKVENEDFGAPPGDLHQDIAHAAAANPAKDRMIAYNVMHAHNIAYLVGLLDSYPEGEGTLLDNTAVVWISEHGGGTGQPHGVTQVPVVIAGSCGGSFRCGRYIRYPRHPWTSVGVAQNGLAPPHNKLLVSLARAMGLDVNSINMTERTLDGVSFDLTGPLPNLT